MFKRIALVTMLCLLLAALPVYAQEGEAAEGGAAAAETGENATDWVTILTLFVGLGAVLAVGGKLAYDNARNPQQPKS